jgi:hypothetical protein
MQSIPNNPQSDQAPILNTIVRAIDLLARVGVWDEGLQKVEFSYGSFQTTLRVSVTNGVPSLLCQCGESVSHLVEHPRGRGLVCAGCADRVNQTMPQNGVHDEE